MVDNAISWLLEFMGSLRFEMNHQTIASNIPWHSGACLTLVFLQRLKSPVFDCLT